MNGEDKHHKSHNKIDVMQDIDAVPSNVQSARQEALLYVFDNNEAVIKMIIKGRSPTMRHVSRTHRVALDWLFDRINLDPKVQIKYIDTKNQLADILTKGNFTRDEWNHLLTLFNIKPFQLYSLHRCDGKTSSTRFRRRTCHSQIATHDEFDREDAFGRVVFSFNKPGEDLVWISVAGDDRTGKPERDRHDQIIRKRIMVDLGLLKSGKVELRSTIDRGNLIEILGIHCKKLILIVRNLFSAGMRISARYGELIHDRTVKPVSVHYQEQAYSENFVMGSDAAEFVNKVKDQVRNRQKRMSNVAESGDEHSIIWGMFMATTLNAATFMGNNFSTIQRCCQES